MGSKIGKAAACSASQYGLGEKEQRLLETVFAGLASRSPGQTMSKKTFLKYFSFPGMFGERLFDVFDLAKNQIIDVEEFLTGIARFLNGSQNEKIQVLFQMFDLNQDGTISLEELRTMCYSMVKDDQMHQAVKASSQNSSAVSSPVASRQNMAWDSKSLAPKISKFNLDTGASGGAPPPKSPAKPKTFVDAERVDEVIQSISNADKDNRDRLADELIDRTLLTFAKGKSNMTFDEFDSWMKASPQFIHYIEFQLRSHSFKQEIRPKAGYLRKRGKTFKNMLRRYCVLQDGFLYQFHSDKQAVQQQPSNAIFLRGLRIGEPSSKDDVANHGILLESDVKSRVLYAMSAAEKKQWVEWLSKESESNDINSEYKITGKIGKGRFADVFKCQHIASGKPFAVKVIDKTTIDDEDKEGLRAEIAILKLVSHPFIVSMKRVYETKTKIYIVMEWLEHGDLFKEVTKRGKFTENVARHVISQVLSAIRYCHLRGIVHKDIKPENILVERIDNGYMRIFVTDFGLSQFAKPSEKLRDAAGSIAYMAPEMIDNETFTKAVDVWGIGVICYALLSGTLPFYDGDEDKWMDNIVEKKLEFKGARWGSISDNAKDFLRKMMHKKPKKRLTCDLAMAHPWLSRVRTLIPLVRSRSNVDKDDLKNGTTTVKDTSDLPRVREDRAATDALVGSDSAKSAEAVTRQSAGGQTETRTRASKSMGPVDGSQLSM